MVRGIGEHRQAGAGAKRERSPWRVLAVLLFAFKISLVNFSLG